VSTHPDGAKGHPSESATAVAAGTAGRDPRRSVAGRLWAAALAGWGAFTGALPHVLHHVGPLAGAAVLAGATGRVLFAAIGFVAAIPFLRRLHRRFGTWKAPAVALAVFAAMFSLSSFVIGPAVAGADTPPGIEQRDHDEHHD
jgi:hypothetical protein